MPISSSCAAAQAGTSRSRSASRAGRKPVSPALRLVPQRVHGLARAGRPAAAACARATAPQSCVDRVLLADDHPRLPARRRLGEGGRTPRPTGRRSRRHGRAPRSSPSRTKCREAAEPAPRDVLEEDALDRLRRAEAEDRVESGVTVCAATPRILALSRRRPPVLARPRSPCPACAAAARDRTAARAKRMAEAERASGRTVAAMPIHLRAEPGDYADAVLLPGDPLRAQLHRRDVLSTT